MRSQKTLHLRGGAAAPFTAVLLALAALHAPLAGQGVTYVTVSKPEMAGAMGMVARMAGGAMGETKVTTSMQGTLYRTDEGEATSTIMDMAAGRYTFLDHKQKTYYSMTVEEMVAQAKAAMGQLSEARQDQPLPEIQVERTGKTQSIEGYPAEQLLMWMKSAAAAGAGAPPQEGETGTMAFLTETWFSKDFPGYSELKKAQEAMATDAAAGMAGAMAGDPAMAEWGKRMAEEMKGLEGIPVRTVTYFVMVPPGVEFDRDALLASADQPVGGGGGGAAASAAGAARQALGGLMGRRRQQQEQPAPDAAPTQNVIMRVTQTVKDVKTGAIPDDRFQVPAGYREAAPKR
jgi:hypothetical protein